MENNTTNNLSIEKKLEGKALTVIIEGSLNTSTSPILDEEITPELETVKELILDLKRVPYVSSAGVRLLLTLSQIMESNGGTLKLVNVGEDIVDLLNTLGFLDILTIE